MDPACPDSWDPGFAPECTWLGCIPGNLARVCHFNAKGIIMFKQIIAAVLFALVSFGAHAESVSDLKAETAAIRAEIKAMKAAEKEAKKEAKDIEKAEKMAEKAAKDAEKLEKAREKLAEQKAKLEELRSAAAAYKAANDVNKASFKAGAF
jgi:cell division protein FtsL